MYLCESTIAVIFAGYHVTAIANIDEKYVVYIGEAIIFFALMVRLRGFDTIIWFSALTMVASVLPAVIFFGAGVRYSNPSLWVRVDGKFDCVAANTTDPLNSTVVCDSVNTRWGEFLSTVAWAFGGIFDIGTLAGQVQKS